MSRLNNQSAISLLFLCLHVACCALRGITHFADFFLPRCTLRAVRQFSIDLWSATFHVSKASIPNFNHSLQLALLVLSAKVLTSSSSEMEPAACCHIMDFYISMKYLSPPSEKVPSVSGQRLIYLPVLLNVSLGVSECLCWLMIHPIMPCTFPLSSASSSSLWMLTSPFLFL